MAYKNTDMVRSRDVDQQQVGVLNALFLRALKYFQAECLPWSPAGYLKELETKHPGKAIFAAETDAGDGVGAMLLELLLKEERV